MFSSSSYIPPAPYPFQTYILPTQPFRRRRSSTLASPSGLYPALSHLSISPPQESSSSYTSSSRPSQKRPRRSSYLQNHTSHISCARCKASLALSSQIISKGFTGRHGRALLVSPSPLDTAAVPACSSPSTYSRRKSSHTLSSGTSGNGAMIRDSVAGNAEQGEVVRPLPPPTRRRSSALSNAFSAAVSLATSPFSPSTTSTSTTPQSYTSTSASWLSRSLSSTTTSPPSSSTSPSSPSSFRSFPSSQPKQSSTPPTTLPNTHTHPAVPRHLVTGLHTVADVSCTVCSSVLGWKYISTEEEAQRYKVGKYILETKRVVVGSEWEGGSTDEDGSVFEFEEEEEEEDGEEGANGDADGDGVSDVDEQAEDESDEDEDEEEEEVMPHEDRQLNSYASTHTATPPPQSQSQPHHNTHIRFTSNTHPRNTHAAANARNANSCHNSFHTSCHTSYHNNDHPSSDENDEVFFDSQDEDECDDLFAGMWSPQVARLRRDSKRRDSARGVR